MPDPRGDGSAIRWATCELGCESCGRLRGAIVALAYERGFRRLAITDVTECAGVTAAVFAEHAGTLDECLLAAYRDVGDDLFARFATAFGGPGSWHERFARGTAAVLEHLAARPEIAHLCYVEAARAGRRMRARRDAHIRRVLELMAAEHDDDGLPALRFELMAGAVDRAVAARVAAGRAAELRELTTQVSGITALFEPVAA